MSYQETMFPCGKELSKSKACVCMCVCAYLHICMRRRTYSQVCFHIPTYHAQVCLHESADVTVLMMIMMMVFIYLRRWKKVDGGWMSAVSRAVERGPRARKREGARMMGSGEEGWMVVCVGREKKERASCGMFTCQCGSSSDWSYLCVRVSVCACLWYRAGFHTEILGFLMVYIKWGHYVYYALSVMQWYVAACNII